MAIASGTDRRGRIGSNATHNFRSRDSHDFVFNSRFRPSQKMGGRRGIVHYEAIGPSRSQIPNADKPKPNARRPLDKNHAGLTLGDDEASFRAAQKGDYVGKSGPNGNYYRYAGTLPDGAINIGALFVAGRLAFIMIDYRDFGVGGWEQLVKETTEKYGPAMGDERTADWDDGATALRFKHEPSGNIKITLEDSAVMSKYSDQEKAALPKF